jgi:hypothetical protein
MPTTMNPGPTSTQLDTVRVRGDWSPLMERLVGWRKIGSAWSDGITTLEDNAHACAVTLRDYACPGGMSIETLSSPEGGIIAMKHGLPTRKYSLTHFALEVNRIGGEEEKFWANTLNCPEVIRAIQRWDPLTDAPMNAVHFYKPNELYVTLRESGTPQTTFHHIGFEAANKQAVLDMRPILEEIGWNNFWEGDLDGSYVLHFCAPDGSIHDVFCPEDALKEEAAKLVKKK